MKNITKIAKGLIIIICTGSILLLSDLNNRNTKSKTEKRFNAEAEAKPGKEYHLGLAYFAPEASFDQLRKGLFDGLKELGYIKGENLDVKEKHVNGEISNFNSLLQTFDNLGLDVIVPTSTPGVTAACAAVKKTPVAFTYTYDPIAAGAGKSYTEHLPNLTGVGSFPPVEKTFKLIKDVIPGVKNIGTIYNSSEANSRKVIEVAEETMAEMGLTLKKTTVVNSSEVIQAIQVLVSRQVDAIWITGDNTAMQAFDAIAGTAKKAGIPVFLNDVDLIDKGALAAVGIGWYATGLHSAEVVAKVMNGADPARIPIENYVNEMVVFNEEMVHKYGITIPKKYIEEEKASIPDKKYHIAMAHYIDSPNTDEVQAGMIDGLKDIGIDYDIKIFNAQGDVSTLNSIVESIKGGNYDLIFTSSTPTVQTMLKKVKNTPIVFTAVADPIAAGIATSCENHEPNITGISTMSDFDGMVQFVKELLPDATRVGSVFCPAEVNSVAYIHHLEDACKKVGLTLVSAPANTATEINDAASTLCTKNLDAICQISDNLTSNGFASIAMNAEKAGLPIFSFINKQVDMGSTAALARDFHQAGYDAAMKAKRVLQGEDIKNVPWGYVSKTHVRINNEMTAKYGITVPEKYLNKCKDSKTLKKIAFVHFMSSRDCQDTEDGFRNGLKEHNWEEGKDYTLKVYNAQSDNATLITIVEAIKNNDFDIIVSNVTAAAQAIAKKITTIPQIFTIVADPVGSGLGKSYNNHLPYLTGIDGLANTDDGIALMLKCLPKAKSVGTLFYNGDIGTVKTLAVLKKSCEKHHIHLEVIPVNNLSEVNDAINILCEKDIDAVFQIPDNVTISSFSSIVKSTRKHKTPLFCCIRQQVREGAIAGVTGDYFDQGMDAATMAIRIFNGEKPGDIPFQSLQNNKVIINTAAAKAYEVYFPEDIRNEAFKIFTE